MRETTTYGKYDTDAGDWTTVELYAPAFSEHTLQASERTDLLLGGSWDMAWVHKLYKEEDPNPDYGLGLASRRAARQAIVDATVTPPRNLAAPAGLAVAEVPGRPDALRLDWQPVAGATGYELQWRFGADRYDTDVTLHGGGHKRLRVPASDARPRTLELDYPVTRTFTVRVRAYSDADASPWSAEAVRPGTAPTLSIRDAQAFEENGRAGFRVVLSEASAGRVTVRYATADGTATAGADYAAANGTVAFEPYETSKIIWVELIDDAVEDSGETFTVSLSAATGGAGIADGEATGTILNREGELSATLSVGDAASQAGRFQVRAAFGETVTGFALDDLSAARVGGDAAAASDLAEVETGRAWTAWVAGSQAGRYVVRLASGAAQAGERTSAAAVLVADVDAQGNATALAGPAVTAVSVAPPGDGASSWGAGEDIEVTLRFSETVTVDTTGGTPSVGLTVGGNARQAAYASGSGSNALVFAYRVVADDGTVTAAAVTASSLATGGGTIRDGAGRAADLAHPGATWGSTAEPEAPAGPMTGFTLVNAATNADVGAIADGGAFTLADPANGSYGVRVETAADAEIGSVKLALSGAKAVTQTESVVPWSLYGDDGTNVAGQGLPVGSYTLTATAHAEAGGQGAVLQTLTVSFTVAAEAVEAPAGDALTAAFQSQTVPAEHEGAGKTFSFQVLFSEKIPTGYKVLRDEGAFAVTNGKVVKARRVRDEEGNGRDDLREIHIEPKGWDDVTVTLSPTTVCGVPGAICMADGRKLSNTQTATVKGPLALSVADARAEEGPGATLDFVVTLSRAASGTVTVKYATADGTATQPDDYIAESGTLTFAAGETEKTVSVTVKDDAHDEGEETMKLILSGAVGARIRDAEGIGTIENSDAIPAAWLARFGRTVADHVVDAVGARLAGPAESGSHVTLGGQRIALDGSGAPKGGDEAAGRALSGREAAEGFAAFADRVAGGTGGAAPGGSAWTQWGEDGRGSDTRTMTERELLLGSSFHLSLGADGENAGAGDTRLTAWGGAASSRFDGEADGLVLDGEVTTFTLGADAAQAGWLAGVAVSLSEGTGSFRAEQPRADGSLSEGELESSLTGVHPYARLEVSERLSLWGLLGYGTGELDLEVGSGERWTTDTRQEMAALGARGVLIEAPETGGLELAARTDAVMQRMRSDAATGSKGGNLAATETRTSRVRLMLEGSRAFETAGGGRLTPSLEVGLRQDGGDAETGAGIELGGGLSWTDPASGLTADVKLRGLVAHEDTDYREWGASGAVRIAPGADGRGLSLSLVPAWGADSGGAERLWSHRDARAFAPDVESEAGSRLEAEVGYGFAVRGGRAVATPWAGWSHAGEDRTVRLGQRLAMGASEWRLESAFGEAERAYGAGYGYRLGDAERAYGAGYGYRLGDALDLTLDATRREAANDDAPVHEIVLRARLRW